MLAFNKFASARPRPPYPLGFFRWGWGIFRGDAKNATTFFCCLSSFFVSKSESGRIGVKWMPFVMMMMLLLHADFQDHGDQACQLPFIWLWQCSRTPRCFFLMNFLSKALNWRQKSEIQAKWLRLWITSYIYIIYVIPHENSLYCMHSAFTKNTISFLKTGKKEAECPFSLVLILKKTSTTTKIQGAQGAHDRGELHL